MQIAKRLSYYTSLLLLAYMPFHVFLAQSMSLITSGLDVWKVAKDVILAIATMFVICVVWWSGRATRWFKIFLGLSAAYALLHGLLWAVHPDIYRQSALIGLTYNLRLPAFLLLGYGTVLLNPNLLERRTVGRLVLVAAAIVAILGVLQYFLPKDILTHFGYSVERGVKPNFFIDDNPLFPRIMSTLRDPNSLGAYLIVPIMLASAWWLQLRALRQRLMLGSFVIVAMIAESLTYSRSAIVAALLMIAFVVWWHYRTQLTRIIKRFWPVVALAVLLIGFIAYTQRNNQHIAGVVTHTTNQQKGQYDSNELHALFVKRGIEGIVRNPFGYGPGTAGLASIQNPAGGQLTENYYVQIGYEVGVFGLLLFVILNVLVYRALWASRTTMLGMVLLGSFWAYVLVNMLLHLWSNEAIACQWWLLAGMVAATGEITPRAGLNASPSRATKQRG